MYEVAWQVSVDEHVYGLAGNAAGDREVVSFRLSEPVHLVVSHVLHELADFDEVVAR